MGFSDFITTREGHLAIAESMAGGGTYTFLEIVLGDGRITSQAPEALTDVISPIYTVKIAEATVKKGITPDGKTENYVLLKAHFKSADIGKSFYFREIGVFAKVGSGEKRMVTYNNAYELADYIDVASSETQDRTLAIPIYVGSVSDISILVNEDMTYVTVDEFEAHKEDLIAHPLNFDNYLNWPGCTRIKDETDEANVLERWVDSETKAIVKASRTTTENEDGSITETLIFYNDDGSVKAKYIITTTQDGEKAVEYEAVVKEVTE